MSYRSKAEKRALESHSRMLGQSGFRASREMERLLHVLELHEAHAVNSRILDLMSSQTPASTAIDEINSRMLEVLSGQFSGSDVGYSNQLLQEIRVLTGRAFHQGISAQIAALAHSIKVPHEVETSRLLDEVVESFNFLIVNLSDHSRESIRNSLAGSRINAERAAFDTVRRLGSLEEDSSFCSFLDAVFNESRILEENEGLTLDSALPEPVMRLQESRDQLTVWLIVITLLIALYSAIQTGQPVKVDPDQLTQYVTRISSELGIGPEAEETFLVERACLLKARPRNKSQILGELVAQDTVHLIYRHHKWAFLQYFDRSNDSVAYGWTYKKYLRRASNAELSAYRDNKSTESSQSLTSEEVLAIGEQWEQTNRRRIALIDKKVDETISESEQQELENLQRLADERIRRFTPLPLDELEMTLLEIKREV